MCAPSSPHPEAAPVGQRHPGLFPVECGASAPSARDRRHLGGGGPGGVDLRLCLGWPVHAAALALDPAGFDQPQRLPTRGTPVEPRPRHSLASLSSRAPTKPCLCVVASVGWRARRRGVGGPVRWCRGAGGSCRVVVRVGPPVGGTSGSPEGSGWVVAQVKILPEAQSGIHALTSKNEAPDQVESGQGPSLLCPALSGHYAAGYGHLCPIRTQVGNQRGAGHRVATGPKARGRRSRAVMVCARGARA